ncbi:hypothetical protein LZG00_06305 [Rhodobacteraceae bacterium LMO-12]|nr:hypothetical protein [Rhodobacteraceae bacterium LMO-JJ12]
MRFHQWIMLVALAVAVLTAGASALPGSESTDITDPGYWLAVGQEVIGVSENGWCSCS